MMLILEKIAGIIPLKCESYDEFIQRVNKSAKDWHATRIEITELHYTTTAILYRKYGLDDTSSKEESKA